MTSNHFPKPEHRLVSFTTIIRSPALPVNTNCPWQYFDLRSWSLTYSFLEQLDSVDWPSRRNSRSMTA